MNKLLPSSSISSRWVYELNPLTKFSAGIILTSILIVSNSIDILWLNLTIIFLFSLSSFGFRGTLSIIYGIRFLLILIPISSYIFLYTLSPIDRLDMTLVITLKVLGIMLSFAPISKTTSPDQLLSSLLALRIPASIAWIITSTYRQAVFFTEELDITLKLLIKDIPSGFISKLRYYASAVSKILIISYGRAIIRSRDYTETLRIRGWNGAHRGMTLSSARFRFYDFLIFLFLLLYLIIISVIY